MRKFSFLETSSTQTSTYSHCSIKGLQKLSYSYYSEKNNAPRALVSEKNTAPRTKHRAWCPIKMKHRATYGHLARCLVRGAVFFSDTKARGAVMQGWPDGTRRGVLFWHKGIWRGAFFWHKGILRGAFFLTQRYLARCFILTQGYLARCF